MSKYKIIVVENDEDEQFFMREGFTGADRFELMAMVENGNALFAWLEKHGTLPDVILSDLNMPGKNGFDILDEIKATPAYMDIPVIITSTSSTKSIIDKCIEKGAADYMVKPDTFIAYEPFAHELHKCIAEKSLVGTRRGVF